MQRLLILLAIISVMPSLRADEPIEGVWSVLSDCHLIASPVNDGDSFRVQHGDTESTFRLYYVDAPETHTTYMDRIRDQARYFSISEDAVTTTGARASKFSQDFLSGPFTVITQWEDARGSSTHKRYFALIQKGDRYLSTELIGAGLARLYGKPTEDTWPGGVSPRSFLGRLKNEERRAQRENAGIWALAAGSMQMSGLEALTTATVATGGTALPGSADSIPIKERINVNTASSAALQELPGIGPALAARIIRARPIASVESLIDIPGISANTLSGFRHQIVTEEPPPPPFTVDFYKADLPQYLDSEVTVHVASVAQSDASSPDSFRAVRLQTAHKGEEGGTITAFIPDEFYESFINYYRESGREFTGLLYSYQDKVVLVYRRP